MDPEREDYEERDRPPIWLPPVGLLVLLVFLLLASPFLLVGLLTTGLVRLR